MGSVAQEIAFGANNYLFVNTVKTWAQASTACSGVGGGLQGYHLVVINDQAEEDFLDSQEASLGLTKWWIGYSDQATEGVWQWTGGFSTFTKWKIGQPDNLNNQDCAVDRSGGTTEPSSWSDEGCGTNHVFVCESETPEIASDITRLYSATNTSDATVNTVQFPVTLTGGKIFTFGTCGLPGASVTSGDTYLRIKNPSGTVVASNDDAGPACGSASNISIVAATTGTYTVHAGCKGTTACTATIAFQF